jgi:hypothetical protein
MWLKLWAVCGTGAVGNNPNGHADIPVCIAGEQCAHAPMCCDRSAGILANMLSIPVPALFRRNKVSERLRLKSRHAPILGIYPDRAS